MALDTTLLYLVVIAIRHPKRRAQIRRMLRVHGQAIHRDTYEIATTPKGIRALETAIALELTPTDQVRIYPVCARCRTQVRLYGEGELETVPVARFY